MVKRYITRQADGTISVLQFTIKGGGEIASPVRLAKALFELSRNPDNKEEHFNPEIHTLDAIAAGLSGHRALALTAECEDTDLPSDRYFRDAWEWSD